MRPALPLPTARCKVCLRDCCENNPLSNVVSQTPVPAIPFPRNQYKQSIRSDRIGVKLQKLSSGILAAFKHHKRCRHKYMISGQWQGFSELQRLRLDGTVRLYVSDKDSEFVVIPESLDKGITEFHLPNGSM